MKTRAMIHSLHDYAEVEIISHENDNHIVAEYQSKQYTAIFNSFVGCYYVDDVYGYIKDSPPKRHEPER